MVRRCIRRHGSLETGQLVWMVGKPEMTMQLLNTAQLNRALLYMACCGLALGLPGRIVAQADQAKPVALVALAASELPDSPGAAWAKAQSDSAPQNSAQATTPPATPTGSSQLNIVGDQTQQPQRPVGTAAAEASKVNGVAAAQPAGVAIAPGKQHRVRTIVLRVGAIVGAGAAVGTVIALTEATSSKPPGAH
jgi:hypothetical protein